MDIQVEAIVGLVAVEHTADLQFFISVGFFVLILNLHSKDDGFKIFTLDF